MTMDYELNTDSYTTSSLCIRQEDTKHYKAKKEHQGIEPSLRIYRYILFICNINNEYAAMCKTH